MSNIGLTCPQVNQLLMLESGRIGPTIYQKTLNDAIWRKLAVTEPWPDEFGDTPSVMVWERTLPSSIPSWSNVQSNAALIGGDSSTCSPSALTIPVAMTLRQFNLQQTALQSPDVCLNDLRFAFQRDEQLANMVDGLAQNAKYLMNDRVRDEYFRIAGHKILVNGGLTESSTAMPNITGSIGKLNQQVLNKVYLKMNRLGGSANAMDRDKGRPVYLLITDSETSENIIKNDTNIRQDFRFSDRVNELLAPLGITRIYGGYFHGIDDFAPRWDWVNGAWVRRYPWGPDGGATQGTRQVLQDLYEAAQFTDSYVFHPDVFHMLVPKPIEGLPGGMTYEQWITSYMGEFKWLNIRDRQCNPLGQIGFFYGLFMNGSKPVRPELGFVMRHQRCPFDLNLTSCSTSSNTGF